MRDPSVLLAAVVAVTPPGGAAVRPRRRRARRPARRRPPPPKPADPVAEALLPVRAGPAPREDGRRGGGRQGLHAGARARSDLGGHPGRAGRALRARGPRARRDRLGRAGAQAGPRPQRRAPRAGPDLRGAAPRARRPAAHGRGQHRPAQAIDHLEKALRHADRRCRRVDAADAGAASTSRARRSTRPSRRSSSCWPTTPGCRRASRCSRRRTRAPGASADAVALLTRRRRDGARRSTRRSARPSRRTSGSPRPPRRTRRRSAQDPRRHEPEDAPGLLPAEPRGPRVDRARARPADRGHQGESRRRAGRSTCCRAPQRALGDLDAAEATARRLLALSPSSTSGAHALAQVLEARRDWAKIVTALEPIAAGSAKGREADMALILTHLGFAYIELGRQADADRRLRARRSRSSRRTSTSKTLPRAGARSTRSSTTRRWRSRASLRAARPGATRGSPGSRPTRCGAWARFDEGVGVAEDARRRGRRRPDAVAGARRVLRVRPPVRGRGRGAQGRRSAKAPDDLDAPVPVRRDARAAEAVRRGREGLPPGARAGPAARADA